MATKAPRRILALSLALLCATLWAQQKKTVKPAAKKHQEEKLAIKGDKKTVLKPQAYLGHSDFKGGIITPQRFDSLMGQGIYSFDNSGNEYRVVRFLFNYAERNLYEDSAGNNVFMTDIESEVCFGNMPDSNITKNVFDRIKSGDTVYIEQVYGTQLKTPADTFLGQGMKCIIRKEQTHIPQ